MTRDGRKEATADELALADEELRGASAFVRMGMPRIALTRAYYAVFHAMRALLYVEGHEPRSHEGVIHLFNLNVVKPGRVPRDTSARIARLQKYREEADYSVAFVVDPKVAADETKSAEELVATIRELVREATK